MGFLGRGISMKFAVAATLYTITGCVLGNLFRVIIELAQATATSPTDVLRNNSLSVLAERSIYNVSFVDLVYLFVAVFCAVFFAKRALSRSENTAQATATSPTAVLRNNSLSVLAERSIYNVSFVDLVYLFVAVFCAVFFAKRPLSRSERLAIGLFELRD